MDQLEPLAAPGVAEAAMGLPKDNSQQEQQYCNKKTLYILRSTLNAAYSPDYDFRFVVACACVRACVCVHPSCLSSVFRFPFLSFPFFFFFFFLFCFVAGSSAPDLCPCAPAPVCFVFSMILSAAKSTEFAAIPNADAAIRHISCQCIARPDVLVMVLPNTQPHFVRVCVFLFFRVCVRACACFHVCLPVSRLPPPHVKRRCNPSWGLCFPNARTSSGASWTTSSA